MADKNEKLIKDAQYRKGLSIAYFNSINASIELAKVMFPDMPGVDVKKFIAEWRDWFLSEHETYYANVIANVGVNFDPKTTKGKMEKCKNLKELRNLWVTLSEDERQNQDIIDFANELKNKYENS